MIDAHPLLPVGDRPTTVDGSAWRATDPALDAADAVFKGLGDPTRLRILNVLAAGELCVCDLVEMLALPQPTVSRHLAYLRRSGLVTATRDWKYAHYQLADPATAIHAHMLDGVRDGFTGSPTLDAERQRAMDRVRAREDDPCD